MRKKDIKAIRFVGCQDVFNPKGVTQSGEVPEYHSVWHFHVIEVTDGFEPTLDRTSAEVRWVKKNSKGLSVPRPVRSALKMAALI